MVLLRPRYRLLSLHAVEPAAQDERHDDHLQGINNRPLTLTDVRHQAIQTRPLPRPLSRDDRFRAGGGSAGALAAVGWCAEPARLVEPHQSISSAAAADRERDYADRAALYFPRAALGGDADHHDRAVPGLPAIRQAV